MTTDTQATAEPPSCRVCGCTADDPCPLGRESSVSCLAVPDPQGSPRLCHWCAGEEAGAVRCDVLVTGLLAGPEPKRCLMGATHKGHWRCTRGHDRRINACRMHLSGDIGVAYDCAECPHEDEVPVRLVSASLLYPQIPREDTIMTRPGYTHLVLLVDRSGSMQPIAADMTGGIAQLISDQAAAPGTATVSLYQFDNRFERVFGPDPVGEAPAYTLRPRGMTALLDALGSAITETGELLAGLAEDHRPEKVIFAVVTDGAENASHEWTHTAVTALIRQQTEAYGWEFAFLSADLSAVGEARDLGVRADASAAFTATPAGTRSAMAGLSQSVIRSRGGSPLTVNGN